MTTGVLFYLCCVNMLRGMLRNAVSVLCYAVIVLCDVVTVLCRNVPVYCLRLHRSDREHRSADRQSYWIFESP
jgi:hypothetical protein